MGRFNLRQGSILSGSRRPVVRSRLAVLLLLAGSAGLLILPLSMPSSYMAGSQADALQAASSSPLLADDLLAIPMPSRIRTAAFAPSSAALVPEVLTAANDLPATHATTTAPTAPTAPTTPTTPTTPTAPTAPTANAAILNAGFCAGLPVSWPAALRQWSVPSGCYSHIFYPSPVHYVSRPSFGWCNWWPEVLHPWLAAYTALHLPSHSSPAVGATIYFAPYVQGASSAGHYAEVVAIGPGGWLLITEMNFSWRGGGFARVDYRFIHIGSGVSFRY